MDTLILTQVVAAISQGILITDAHRRIKQGYLFGRPMAIHAFEAALAARGVPESTDARERLPAGFPEPRDRLE